MLHPIHVPPTLAQELVRAIRGGRSQEMLRRRLGAKYNRVSLWETGRAKIDWLEFVELCEACKVKLQGHFALGTLQKTTPDDVTLITRRLVGEIPHAEICKALGISRASLARWLSGQSVPLLQDVLALMSANRAMLFAFLEKLVDPADLPSLAEEYRLRTAMMELAEDFPFMNAATYAFNLKSYRDLPAHSPGILSVLLGISLKDEERLIEAYLKRGLLKREGKRLVPNFPKEIFLGPKVKGIRAVRKYWLDRFYAYHMRMLEEPYAAKSLRVFFSASNEAAQRLREEQGKFLKRMEKIRADDESVPHDAIFVLWMQFLDLAELK